MPPTSVIFSLTRATEGAEEWIAKATGGWKSPPR